MGKIHASHGIGKADRMKIDWGEALVPGIGIIFGLSFFLQVGDAPKDAVQWPSMTAVALLPLFAIILVKFVLKEDTASKKLQFNWLWKDGRRVLFIFCAAVVYLLLMPYLGFSVSNFLMLLVVFKGLGGHGWIKNISIALGITLFLHLALITFMQLSIPRLIIGPITI